MALNHGTTGPHTPTSLTARFRSRFTSPAPYEITQTNAFEWLLVVFLKKSDWKYERSSAGEGGGGRTHTFGVKHAAQKLHGKAVYQRRDVVIRDGNPIPRNGLEE